MDRFAGGGGETNDRSRTDHGPLHHRPLHHRPCHSTAQRARQRARPGRRPGRRVRRRPAVPGNSVMIPATVVATPVAPVVHAPREYMAVVYGLIVVVAGSWRS